LTYKRKCSILYLEGPAGLFKLAGRPAHKTMGITTYIKETRAEFKHVTWPSKRQALAYSLAVVIISVFTAYLLGAFDALFQFGLSKLIGF
jgi:preprotein translocase SecE subunit